MDEFDRVQQRVRWAIARGHSLDRIDEQVIEPSDLSADHKSALWVMTWCCQPAAARPSLRPPEIDQPIALIPTRSGAVAVVGGPRAAA